MLRGYGVTVVFGDRYGGHWPQESFRRHEVEYEPAAKPKSDLYRDALTLLNGGSIELPAHDRLAAQFVGLERRTARGGRDSVDRAPGARDDVANVVCGLAVELTGRPHVPEGLPFTGAEPRDIEALDAEIVELERALGLQSWACSDPQAASR